MPVLDVVTECPLRILVAVTFHFRESRLQYLFQVIRAFSEYPVEVLDVVIITNVDHQIALKQITDLCTPLFRPFPLRPRSKRNLSIESFPNLPDPLLLAWSHKHLIADRFLSANSAYTHFIYAEDDILISFDNFCYFIYYRELLMGERLIPSFQRVEYNDVDNRLYLLDQVGVSDFRSRKRVDVDGYAFVNLDYPYSAMFILDRDLALEYVETPSFDQERSKSVRPKLADAKYARERAAMGLCFENLPQGFMFRHVSPVDRSTLMTPYWSWIYHLTNNYAKDRLTPFAKTRTDKLFDPEGNVITWQPPSIFARLRQRVRNNLGI
jgi:hypothetical protein